MLITKVRSVDHDQKSDRSEILIRSLRIFFFRKALVTYICSGLNQAQRNKLVNYTSLAFVLPP